VALSPSFLVAARQGRIVAFVLFVWLVRRCIADSLQSRLR
jgi:hypothetical protein